MTPTLLQADAISKSYSMGEVTVDALNNISLDFGAGNFAALTGPSGSGKSTLLNLLSGLATPTAGRVLVDGEDITGLTAAKKAKFFSETCGYIFQTFNLVPVLSALENVELPLWQSDLSKAEVNARAAAILERVGLSDRMDHRPARLSGGQQQRVAIARALVNSPKILFADEPTANLDHATSMQIMGLIQEMNSEMKCLCILSTHDRELVQFAQREIKLKDGKVVQ